MLSFLIHVLFYQPIFNILMVLYDLLWNNLGLAIIAIAGFAKLITIPLTRKQLESSEQMKVFNEKSKEVRKKYAKNTEKMNEELMKLSSKYMPAQLGGCLPLIISIIFLVQIRGVVIDLVNKGYHSFNEVAYVQSIKKEEDSIKFTPSEDLENGKYELKLEVEATNGTKMQKIYKFEVVDNIDNRLAEIKQEELAKTKGDRLNAKEEELKNEKSAENLDMSIYSDKFDNKDAGISKSVVLNKKYVVLPDETVKVNLFDNHKPEFGFYMRPPSDEWISSVRLFLGENEVTDKSVISKGEQMNLNFFGMDISRVGSEYFGKWFEFIPYLVLGILLGVSQFFVTKIQMGISETKKVDSGKKPDKEKKKLKEKDKAPEDMDFSSMMQESSKSMIYYMPIFSVLMSLGYLGGSKIFPAAVSIFWTAQNSFVIIQLAFNKRVEIIEKFKAKFLKK